MMKQILIGGVALLFLSLWGGCQPKKVVLNEQQFEHLLIDLHRLDGLLASDLDDGDFSELKNYAYYNGLFKKYGITRADFDSCMHYYSAKSVLFDRMYDRIVDSLNKELTRLDRILKELKANDSVNYFPTMDTLFLDSVCTVVVDSIVPGYYKFSTTLQFDSSTTQRIRRISSFFLSEDRKDTLRVRDIVVAPDTHKRSYRWEQYADSVYKQLVINYMEIVPWERRPKVLKDKKWVLPSKQEKIYQLKDFGGKAWNNQLFRPYISKREEKQWKQLIRH